MRRLAVLLVPVALLVGIGVEGQTVSTPLPDWAWSPTYVLSPSTIRPIDGKGRSCSFLTRGAQQLDFKIDGWGTASEVPINSSRSKRFVLVKGLLRHDQNPNRETFPAEPELGYPGYDRVSLVVDVARCRVEQILSIEPPTVQDWSGCEMFAYDDSALFINNGERTFIYSGEGFKVRAAVLEFETICSGRSLVEPYYQYWFPGGYYTLSSAGACFLAMHRDTDRHRLVKAIRCEDLVENRASPGVSKQERGDGIIQPEEEVRLREPVFLDEKYLVLHYETQPSGTTEALLRKAGGVSVATLERAVSQPGTVTRRFLSAVSLASLQTSQTQLPVTAVRVSVEREAGGLRCRVFESGSEGAQETQRSLTVQLPK